MPRRSRSCGFRSVLPGPAASVDVPLRWVGDHAGQGRLTGRSRRSEGGLTRTPGVEVAYGGGPGMVEGTTEGETWPKGKGEESWAGAGAAGLTFYGSILEKTTPSPFILNLPQR